MSFYYCSDCLRECSWKASLPQLSTLMTLYKYYSPIYMQAEHWAMLCNSKDVPFPFNFLSPFQSLLTRHCFFVFHNYSSLNTPPVFVTRYFNVSFEQTGNENIFNVKGWACLLMFLWLLGAQYTLHYTN